MVPAALVLEVPAMVTVTVTVTAVLVLAMATVLVLEVQESILCTWLNQHQGSTLLCRLSCSSAHWLFLSHPVHILSNTLQSWPLSR